MSAPIPCRRCGVNLSPEEATEGLCPGCRNSAAGAVVAFEEGHNPRELLATEAAPLTPRAPLPFPDLILPTAYKSVRRGVYLIRAALVAMVLCGVGATASRTASGFTRGASTVASASESGSCFGVVRGLAALVFLVGLCYCCALPPGCGAKKWARALIASILLAVLLIVVAVPALGPLTRGGRSEGAWPSALVISLVERAAGVTISLFLSLLLGALARFFGDSQLGKWFITYAFLWALLMLTTFGAGLLPYLIHPAAPTANGSATGDFWGAGMTAVGALTAGKPEQTLLQILNWTFYLLQVAMSVWLLVLLTRLYRLIPAPQGPERRGAARPPGL